MSIMLVDKPEGITSFDVIRRLQKTMGRTKMGHAGTLDPMATGLMIIATEHDTKKLSQFLKLPKVYEAEILFGTKTDTGDITGNIVETKPVQEDLLSKENLVSVLAGMVGVLKIPVPLYSAIKRQGKPLYEYARKGIAVDVPSKDMEIKSADVISVGPDKATVRFYVGSGTYIRSLAEEFGERLHTVATLSKLRRISIGEYDVKNASTLNP